MENLSSKLLMIGNLVKVDDIPVIVKQVYEGGIIIDIGEGDEECDSFKPIPITEEILSKNFGHTIVLDDYPFEYTEWFTNGFKLQKFNDNMYYWIAQGSDAGIMQVKYVHQLQQILRLLNIDIDFKL